MHVLCPHCRSPIELARVTPREEVACPSCGSSFVLEGGSTVGRERLPGRKLGRFELLDAVGQGAFGTVYKARDPELDRTVAVKVPRVGDLAGEQELDRFLREARSVAQLRHPAIVAVHEVGTEDGVPYLVSDFVQGVTLADVLSARRPGFRDAAELVAAVADALHFAHERGVVHRDVKPSNVMIGEDGRPVVMDFGLAKRDAGEVTMTLEGQILGTPAYMSPEQARGDAYRVDGRSDVYSLGVILYELLTGELPFLGTQRMLLLQVLQDEPRPPRKLNDKAPVDLETVCLKCLHKDPHKRYATAQDLADDLRRFLAGQPVAARPVGRAERLWRWCKRHPAVAALTATVALLLVAGAATASALAVWAVQEKGRADVEAGHARQGERQAKDKEAEVGRLLDRTRRVLMTTQLLNVAAVHRQNPVAALALLEDADACPPEWRDDFAWRYYHARCQRWRLRWEWPPNAIDTLAVSPDGRLLATAKGKLITLWELNTGKKVATLEGHTLPVSRLTFGPGSAVLASAAHEGGGGPHYVGKDSLTDVEVKVWDLASGRARFGLTERAEAVATLAFSGDGRELAAGFLQRGARVWDAESGKELAHLPEIGPYVALSPDGRLIAAEARPAPPGPGGSVVEVWDVAKNQRRDTFPLQKSLTVAGANVAFLADGKALAAVGDGLSVWDLELKIGQHTASETPLSGEPYTVVTPNYTRFERRNVAASPDGKTLATLVSHSNVAVWHTGAAGERFAIQGPAGQVRGASFTDGGKGLAVFEQPAGGGIALRVWSLEESPERLVLPNATGAAFLPDGLVTADDGRLKLIDLDTGREELLGEVTKGQSWVFAASPDGQAVAFAAEGGDVRVWDVPSRRPRFTLHGWAMMLRFSPDSTRIALSVDNAVKVYDAKTGAEVATLQPDWAASPLTVTGVAYAPDGQTLAAGGTKKPLQLFDLRTGEVTRTLSRPLIPLWYLSDDRLLAADAPDRKAAVLKVWDLGEDRERGRLNGVAPWVGLPALSPGGKALATPGNEVVVWDLATGQARLRLPGAENGLVAFSPDGRFLAFAGMYGGLRVWDTRALEETVIRPGQ